MSQSNLNRRATPPFRWLFVGLGLLIIILVATSFVFRADPLDDKIKVGYIPFSTDLIFFVALDQGYFEETGVEIEPVRFNQGSEATNALLAGQVDVLAPVAFSVLLPAAEKSPDSMKLFLPVYETDHSVISAVLVQQDSPIRIPEQLKGKTIGTYSGAPQLLFLRLVLEGMGLDPDKDVTIEQVSMPLQLEALETGRFDALFTVDPYVTIATKKIDARILIENPRSKYIVNPLPMGSCVVSTEFQRQRPDDVKSIYEAMSRAIDKIEEDPIAAKAVLAKYTPISEDLAAETGMYQPFRISDNPNMEAINRLVGKMRVYNILDTQLDAPSLFLSQEQLEE